MSNDYLVPQWNVPNRVHAVVSTRKGGVSVGEYASLNLGGNTADSWTCVEKNRVSMAQTQALPAEPFWLRQVHGSRVVRAGGNRQRSTEADACITRDLGTVCVVTTADCLPVLVCDRRGQEVAAAHAGWRGLAAGILENTVRAFTSEPRELVAWLGPAISRTHFEVGAEVRAQFVAKNSEHQRCFVQNQHGRWQADLYDLARLSLEHLGVEEISGGGFCTYEDQARFYSYRRDGETGRMASMIWLA